MVSFIEKEAQEKASEIRVKAEEEFNIEKSNMFKTEQHKLAQEYERKMKQNVVNKKIAHSNELAKARLELLKRRETGVQVIFDKAKNKLDDISRSPQYKELIVNLVIQCLQRMEETVVEVTCREEDAAVVKDALPIAQERWHKSKNQVVEISLNTEQYLAPSPKNAGKSFNTCAGGVVVSAFKGRIICNNTLDVRLQLAYEQAVPELRYKLFGKIQNL